MKDQKNKIKVGFTTGDMNGIGPEILLNSLKNTELLSLCTPVIYGPIKNLNYTLSHLGFDLTFNRISSAEKLQNGKINVVDNFKNLPQISFGSLSKEIGAAAFESIRSGVKDLKDGKIDVLVTPPINKEAIHSKEFRFMGHTDYINSEINGSSTMMMVSNDLRVALLTEHIPISNVTDSITPDYVENKVYALNETLMRDFQIERPKIAILSIDPHAGDGGVIAANDKKLIVPAIKKLYDLGILAYGPFSADSFFGSDEHKKYDLIIASYHDQGLIPFKTLSFGMGVNYTSGLDKIRTSPDHGTAYSIAGKGVASRDSFLCSIYLAIDIYRRRKIYDEFSKNKLEISK
ncbi:MAG: 4-hydroxythreonine-4-phosphate dehydrogenase PdxA [Flavobacteriaceae bacterium]|nr:4-hydroxythreonine-4-phosphate dehydrogenase PdxA [Flavobacteriaceae bacterium]